MRWALPAVGPELAGLRGWSGTARLLRLLLLVTGLAAVGLGWSGRPGVPAVVALVGLVGVGVAVVHPYGTGPTVVLAAAGITWAARGGFPSVPLTLLLMVLLAVHHQAAALAAVLPVTARVDRRLLVRTGRHLGLVLALSGLVAVLALGVARPGGSVLLELFGLAAAVVVTAALVAAGR